MNHWKLIVAVSFATSIAFATAKIAENSNDKRETVRAVEKKTSGQQTWYSNFEELSKSEPIFDNSSETNVTVQLGGTAKLPCRIRNLGERTISWVRRRDWHILTSGTSTYTNDDRFSVHHPEGSTDWTLYIKYIQNRDNGTYECQVSTSTGVISQFTYVNIVTPEAYILGAPGDVHVDVGNVVHLECIIEKSSDGPQFVFWYHNGRQLDMETVREGVTIETQPSRKTTSKLVIRDVQETETGNYTCSAPNTISASVLVFVSEGDTIAAISRRKASCGSAVEVMLWFVVLPLLTITARRAP